ncbi:MAG: lipoate--protein ligase family protein [Actinomycetota bacterium]|nr:lipoate--protein ligase family protein [Actinomycetota bacterium]
MQSSMNKWRLIEDGPLPGARNMARDEAIAYGVASGCPPALRFYSFNPPCITIGRFQEFPLGVNARGCLEYGVNVVRRPTGGLAILHKNDFTYSVAVPFDTRDFDMKRKTFNGISLSIVSALRSIGIEAKIVEHRNEESLESTWCFAGEFGVDIEWNGKKVCGSAQRSIKGAILQHGSLILDFDMELFEHLSHSCAEKNIWKMSSIMDALCKPVSREDLRNAFIHGFSEVLSVEFVSHGLFLEEEKMAMYLESKCQPLENIHDSKHDEN